MTPALPGSRPVRPSVRFSAYVEVALATDRFAESMRRLTEAFQRFSREVLGLVDAEYRAHGPRNLAADGTWQSDLCAAWVHGSCPSPLLCQCTCHGGTVR